jgi:hypothetical protein
VNVGDILRRSLTLRFSSLSYETRHFDRADRSAGAFRCMARLAAMSSTRIQLFLKDKLSGSSNDHPLVLIRDRIAGFVAYTQARTTALLSNAISASRFSHMAVFRAFAIIFLCAGLIIQGSAAASAVPQAEPMLASDCAQMMHHSEEGEAAHHHSDDTDAPCDMMSLDCLLAMNVVSPVWVGSNLQVHLVQPIFDNPVYLSNISSPLFSRVSTPASPPPRT